MYTQEYYCTILLVQLIAWIEFFAVRSIEFSRADDGADPGVCYFWTTKAVPPTDRIVQDARIATTDGVLLRASQVVLNLGILTSNVAAPVRLGG